jgi:hypothetical protein
MAVVTYWMAQESAATTGTVSVARQVQHIHNHAPACDGQCCLRCTRITAKISAGYRTHGCCPTAVQRRLAC